MAQRQRRTKGRGTLLSRLAALEDRLGDATALTLFAQGPSGECWACTGDGRLLTGAQAKALLQVARQRGASFAHVADVDLPLILGVQPHPTEFSGRTDAHGGVASLKTASTPDTHDVEAPSNC
jgi:hypothetical protein